MYIFEVLAKIENGGIAATEMKMVVAMRRVYREHSEHDSARFTHVSCIGIALMPQA